MKGGSLLRFFVSERGKIPLSLNKVKKNSLKLFFHFFNILILIKIIFFFVPDSLAVRYLGANSCWYGFGTSALSGSITQLPVFLLHPLTCTLFKLGIISKLIKVFITFILVVGIIVLRFENKYFSPKPVIERNALNLGR
ncbi:permease [Methanosarcina sp.]|uniref:permease n=1 Tax=Methanosarcina sp. TaxID=2213 RepID=UPI002ABB122F|nr:permease [Methanosarcina sp.]MDY9925238.1 permease [Methanosarcina sp.]